MMMRPALLLPAILVLAGCLGPREQCESAATRDLRTLNGLIAETEANVNRGYAEEWVTVRDEVYRPCRNANGNIVGCWVPVYERQRRAEAIDLDAERAKLSSMLRKREELRSVTQRALQQCRATYPE